MSSLLTPQSKISTAVLGPGSMMRPYREPSPVAVGRAPSKYVPGYVVLDELGRGGMGIVFRARDLKLNRDVALKMMLAGEFAAGREAERFQFEADAVARIQHANIVQVYEVGNSFGRPFMAMEFVAGGSLAVKAADTPQPIEASAELVELIARALHAAHRQGVLHRDLKPSNILLAPPAPGQELRSAPHALQWFGVPKVTDFGLAKVLDTTSAATQSKTLMGTPSYMAPEQTVCTAAGGSRLGPATDVYGLGAVLYELLTGRPPFDSNDPMDTLVHVRTAEPIPPSYWRPQLPRDLQTVCLKCLNKDPRQRYASAEALADDLRRFLDGKPVLAKPTSPTEKAIKWAKRRPAVAGLLAACLLIAVIGVAGVFVQWRKAESARSDAVQAGDRLREQLDLSARSLYVSRLNNSRLNWRNSNATGAALELNGAAKELRGFEWHILHRQQTAELWSFFLPQCVHRTRFSPDVRTVYVAIGDPSGFPSADAYGRPGKVVALDLDAEKAAWVNSELPSSVRQVTVAPDGSTLFASGAAEQGLLIEAQTGETIARFAKVPGPAAYHPHLPLLMVPSGNDVIFVDSRTGSERTRWRNLNGRAAGAAFSPDGRAVLLTIPYVGLQIHDAADGRLLQSFSTGNHPTLSPSGRFLASIGPGSQVSIVRMPTDWSDPDQSNRTNPTLHSRCQGHDGPIHCLAFGPDELEIAAGGRDGTVRTWHVNSGLPVHVWRGHTSGVSDVCWSNCGQYLLAGSEYVGGVKIWDTSREPEQSRIGTLPHKLFNTEALAFESDSQSILGVSLVGDLIRWNAATGAEHVIAKLPIMNAWSTPTRRAAIHANSRRLAAVGRDLRTVHLFRTSDGSEIRALSGHKHTVNSMRFSPDGRWLATSAFGRGSDKVALSEVILWDVETGEAFRRWDGFPADVYSFSFSSDSTRLAAGGRQNRDWTRDRLRDPALRMLSLPDGDWQDIAVLDAASDSDLATIGPVVALEFHPRRDELAASFMGAPAIVMIWECPGHEPPQRKLKMELPSHIFALAHSNDGQRLIGAGRDAVRIWDALTGQEILMLRGAHQAPGDPGVNPQLALSPLGDALAASNWDGSISCWSATPQSDELRARERVAARGRSAAFRLTRAELCAAERLSDQATWHLDAIRGSLAEESARRRAFDAACKVGDYANALAFWDDIHRNRSAIDWSQWPSAAALVLHVRGSDGYADHCREMAEHLAPDGSAGLAARIVEACTLEPGPIRAADLVERCVPLIPMTDANESAAPLGKALYQLRSGAFDAAIATARAMIDSSAKNLDVVGRSARAAAVIAVAQVGANRHDEARAAVEQAKRLVQKLEDSEEGWRHWHDRLVVATLIREAESALPNRQR